MNEWMVLYEFVFAAYVATAIAIFIALLYLLKLANKLEKRGSRE